MILQYFRNLIFPTKEQREEREAESKLEEEIRSLYLISSRATGSKGEFHHRQNSNPDNRGEPQGDY